MESSEKLAQLIYKLGMSRLQVADYLGVSERTIYRWVAGHTHVPRMVFIAMQLLKPPK